MAPNAGGSSARLAGCTSPARPRPSCALSALPRDVFDAVVRCLVGGDLLHLASVNSLFFEELLADPALWAAHLPQLSPAKSPRKLPIIEVKAQYATLRSLRFRGVSENAMKAGDRGAGVELLRFLPSSNQRSGQLFVPLTALRLSLDMWFSIAGDEKDGRLVGGILLGAQSARWQDDMVWADFHQQFIHVDPQRRLYCTLVGDKSVVATLSPRRWYHLALVFDMNEERVYLNGEMVRRSYGSLHRDWRSLYFMQLGTGCISAGSVGAPTARSSGWYPFNGFVDEFRVWDHALNEDELRLLARDIQVLQSEPSGALSQCEKTSHLGSVERVRCSRPRERVCVEWQ